MALLSLAIWTPIVFGVVLLAMGRDEHVKAVRALALMGALLSLLLTLPLYGQFQYDTSAMQFVEKAAWIPHLNIHYHLGLDGISFWFVLLTAFMTVIVVIAGWQVITAKVLGYAPKPNFSVDNEAEISNAPQVRFGRPDAATPPPQPGR